MKAHSTSNAVVTKESAATDGSASNTRHRPPRTLTYDQLSSCPDMEPAFVDIYERCKPYTVTSIERMYGLFQAVGYILDCGIPGAFVECGVWKGGSAMVAAMALQLHGETDRDLWLYDTFDGMAEPTSDDVDYDNVSAATRLARGGRQQFNQWFNEPLEHVRANLETTGYSSQHVQLIKGMVEDTIPRHAPDQIALLRLDTDWYASTYHEMTHLFPRLVSGGVIVIDDYGHWKGCRKAVDQYSRENGVNMLLSRLDYTGRMGIKP